MPDNLIAHALTVAMTSAQGAAHALGYKYRDPLTGNEFKYHKFRSAVAKGYPVGHFSSGTSYGTVTATLTSSSAALFAGIVQVSAAVALSYGWIQVAGNGVRAVQTTGTINAAGLRLQWTENNKFGLAAATGSARPFGIVSAQAESGTALKAGEYYLAGVT